MSGTRLPLLLLTAVLLAACADSGPGGGTPGPQGAATGPSASVQPASSGSGGPGAGASPEVTPGGGATAAPVPSPSPATSPSPAALPSAAPGGTTQPGDEATPAPVPSDAASPTPSPEPAIRLRVTGETHWVAEGADHVEVIVRTRVTGIDPATCSLTHTVVPDKPDVDGYTESLRLDRRQVVLAIDGLHRFKLACPTPDGTMVDRARFKVVDRLPEACAGWSFPELSGTPGSPAALAGDMAGTWAGCVTTPWVPAYRVRITFREDGTYSSVSGEVLDFQSMIAMYYGSDLDEPAKRWGIDSIAGDGTGTGWIDIAWSDVPSVNHGELQGIRLDGDRLRFAFFHRGTYGPLVYELERIR